MTPGSDYATRDDLDRLRADLRDTERLLRDRDDDKEKGLRAEFIAAVQASEDRTHQRFDGLEAHLDKQDELLLAKREIWPKWRRDLLLSVVGLLAVYLLLHFILHVVGG